MLVGVLLLIETLEYFGLVPENLSILNRVLVSIEESFNRDDVVAKGWILFLLGKPDQNRPFGRVYSIW